ncbi:MAG: hypothetical protein WCC98_16760 [Candidatus Acidiferrales bacterium]
MSDELLNKISQKLDQLVALAAASAAKGMKQPDAIVLLGAVGLDRTVIAQILGTTPGTVSVRLSEAKATKKTSKKKKVVESPLKASSEEQD